MNYLVKAAAILCLISLMACTIGNGHICGPQTPQAYCDREAYERLMHPKGIGEYWEKPDKTVEGWRSDWVACGGRPNGDYLPYKPDGPGDKDFDDAYKKKEKHLWICMTQKGYKFNGKYWPE
jgi:hypothetical protein